MTKLKKASFNIEVNLLKSIKLMAFKRDTTQTDIINQYIKEGLKKDEKKFNRDNLIINNKLPLYDKNKKVNLDEITGIVKLDYKTNAVDLKNNIHTKKD